MSSKRCNPHARSVENNEPSARNLEIYAKVIDGQSLAAVAKQYSLSKPRVQQIHDAVNRWLRPQFTGEINTIRQIQTKLYLHIFMEAMAEWEFSKLPIKKRRKKVGMVGDKDVDTVDYVTEGSHGDPRYMESAMRALDSIRRMWGVDAPVKVAPTTPDGEMSVPLQLITVETTKDVEAFSDIMKRLTSNVGSSN